MDNSPEYILMCEKAQEIQDLEPAGFNLHSETEIWLPRQDQLQEMCFYENRNTLFVLQVQDFYCFFFRQLLLDIHNGSMEKAWLMYVMETKFSKRWNHNEQNWEEIK